MPKSNEPDLELTASREAVAAKATELIASFTAAGQASEAAGQALIAAGQHAAAATQQVRELNDLIGEHLDAVVRALSAARGGSDEIAAGDASAEIRQNV